MASSLGELFIELGVFADTKELQQFEERLKKVNDTMKKTKDTNNKLSKNLGAFIKGLAGVATAITGAIYAVNKLTDSLVAQNQEFLNLTRNSDIALGTFQKWNNIGRMLGVRNAAQQIASLNQKLFELKLTGQGAEGFILAGINPLGQDAEGVMEQLRNRVAGLDDTAATFLLSRMGIDPSMLHLLRMTREEFEAFNQVTKQYRLSEEQTKQIQALNIQLETARIKLQYLKDRAILLLMPYLVKFTQSLARVTEFLTKTKVGVALLATVITGTLIPALIKLFALFSAHPIVAAITAILGVLYLLVDDIMSYFQGGGSMFGVLLKAFDELNQKINSIQTPKWMRDIWNFAQAMTKITNALNPLLIPAKLTGMPTSYDDFSRMFLPGSSNSTTNNTTNNNSQQITMNNAITTSQAGTAVLDELAYVQNTAYSFL